MQLEKRLCRFFRQEWESDKKKKRKRETWLQRLLDWRLKQHHISGRERAANWQREVTRITLGRGSEIKSTESPSAINQPVIFWGKSSLCPGRTPERSYGSCGKTWAGVKSMWQQETGTDLRPQLFGLILCCQVTCDVKQPCFTRLLSLPECHNVRAGKREDW